MNKTHDMQVYVYTMIPFFTLMVGGMWKCLYTSEVHIVICLSSGCSKKVQKIQKKHGTYEGLPLLLMWLFCTIHRNWHDIYHLQF